MEKGPKTKCRRCGIRKGRRAFKEPMLPETCHRCLAKIARGEEPRRIHD